MARSKNIGSTLFGKGRSRVLGVLFTRTEPMYMREIIAAVGGGQGQVQRELENLHRAGLVRRERRANQIYYSPDRAAPIYEELKAIAFKTFGVRDVLCERLQGLRSKIDVAFIYGSVARAEETARSDVDVLIVGAIKFSDAVLALKPAEEALRRSINPNVYSAREFRAKLREKGGFVQRVMGETKLYLIGGDHELGELAGHRKAQAA